jgi:hypothetical protein
MAYILRISSRDNKVPDSLVQLLSNLTTRLCRQTRLVDVEGGEGWAVGSGLQFKSPARQAVPGVLAATFGRPYDVL